MLYIAAEKGRVDAIKVLLRAKADPLLAYYSSLSGLTIVPLDVAAQNGHLLVARELIQEHEIEGCGGASGGMQALQLAAETQHVEMMGMLTRAGVVDPGSPVRCRHVWRRVIREVPVAAAEAEQYRSRSWLRGLLGSIRQNGFASVEACRPSSPRITRLLIDAGADTTMVIQLKNAEGVVISNDTPLAFVAYYLSVKKANGKDATEEQLHSLEATRRLLLRVEAVHAVSWLWASDVPFVANAAAEGSGRATMTPTPLTSMLPILRRRAGRPRVLLAALFRNPKKP